MNALAKNKKLMLGVIFLMLIILVAQLVNILSGDNESDDDNFEFIGSYYELQTNEPEILKNFYLDNLNFYALDLKGNYIANDAVRIKIVEKQNPVPQKIILRVNHLSRLFRKLIKNKVPFSEPKHLNENDFLSFTISDPAGNTVVVIEE